MKLNGKIAIVTGAGSGIGEAIAIRFAEEGAKVVLVGRTKKNLERTLEKFPADANESIVYEVDVTDEEGMKKLFDDVFTRFGRIDIVVNNAGIGIAATVTETTTEQWDQLMDINVKGVFFGCKYSIPYMQRQGGGVIINMSSIAGVVGMYSRAAYCTSKSAINGLTKSIALDYAEENIRAVAICPGTVETAYVDKILRDHPNKEEQRRAMEQRQPIGRMGTPEEIANATVFIASDEASFVTGSEFIIDGGLVAR